MIMKEERKEEKGNARVDYQKEIKFKEITPRLLNVDQTAVYLGIAAKTIRNRISLKAENPFPVKPKRIGGRVLFDRKDLDSFIDSLSVE